MLLYDPITSQATDIINSFLLFVPSNLTKGILIPLKLIKHFYQGNFSIVK